MTCIVAMIEDGKVWMGADHLGSDGFIKTEYVKNDKVFKNGDFLIGYTTSFRMGQILQYSWSQPTRPEGVSDDVYFYKHVLNSFHQCFKDNDYGQKRDEDWSFGEFLVGWKGRLFVVQNSIALEHERFASVGSGCYHALGAMKALALSGYLEGPQQTLEIALEVASGSVCTVGGGKYTFITEG